MQSANTLPDQMGHFGQFGGRFVPETLMPAVHELEREYRAAQADETFAAGLDQVRADAKLMLADELAAAEKRHRGEITRLETEAAESRDAATTSSGTSSTPRGAARSPKPRRSAPPASANPERFSRFRDS